MKNVFLFFYLGFQKYMKKKKRNPASGWDRLQQHNPRDRKWMGDYFVIAILGDERKPIFV